MAWWVWMLLGFVLLVAELLTPGAFYFLFLGVAAMIIGMLGLLGINGPAWMEWLLFSAVALLLIGAARKPLRERFKLHQRDDEDMLVGQTGRVLDEIPAGGSGRVELRGSAWNARNVGSQPLPPGAVCTVEAVEGVMLEVRAREKSVEVPHV